MSFLVSISRTPHQSSDDSCSWHPMSSSQQPVSHCALLQEAQLLYVHQFCVGLYDVLMYNRIDCDGAPALRSADFRARKLDRNNPNPAHISWIARDDCGTATTCLCRMHLPHKLLLDLRGSLPFYRWTAVLRLADLVKAEVRTLTDTSPCYMKRRVYHFVQFSVALVVLSLISSLLLVTFFIIHHLPDHD
jgi:hypothetical protein